MTPRSLSTPNLTQFWHEHPEAVAAITCAILVVFGWLCLNFGWIGLALLILPIAYVVGGYESTKEGLTTLVEDKQLDVDFLMVIAALGAASLGLWKKDYSLIIDGAILILIFALSGALESFAMKRTERNIRQLMAVTPDTARIICNNAEQNIPIEQLKIGDQVIVKPGELIPTDAVITEGYSSVNQASITGESIPVEKSIGDEVFAGTLNGQGVLRLNVHQPPESSLIQRVIRLVEQAQTDAPPSQAFIEKFERGYAFVIVIFGIILAIIPPIFFAWDWETTIYRALVFLVVASPCALMAAIMPTLLSGIANGAKQGILFKNGAQLEKIGQVQAIAFDKTGTLTTGKLEVVDVVAAPDVSTEKLLQFAAALESVSEHPVGKAITEAASQQNFKWQTAVKVEAKVGQGIIGEVFNQIVIIGKEQFIFQEIALKNNSLKQKCQELEKQGKTVVWVAVDGQILGLIAVSDTVRPEAKSTIQQLKQLGIEHIVMLTGDNQQTADTVAQQLEIDQVYANLLPEDKLNVIRGLQKQGKAVAMVGDGINDAPALALANVGIAMGGVGTDVALETADIVLMSGRLERLIKAINLGCRSNRIVKQNIIFALSFIFLLLVANFAGQINLPVGVFGHEGSTVLVTLSGLRLLRN